MNKINNYAMTLQDQNTQDSIMELNEKILAKGKEKILKALEELPDYLSPQNIKHISGTLNESFMQNRLLRGESTQNVEFSLEDVYAKILDKSQKRISEPIQD
jgi:hypothetical protein